MLPCAARFGDTKVDSMRNLYIRRRENTGTRPVVQLDAHSDEVGFMVQAIRPDGLLRILPLGGWVTHNVPAHKVWVRNRFGEYIPGLTASTPPHFMTRSAAQRPRWKWTASAWTSEHAPVRRRSGTSECA